MIQLYTAGTGNGRRATIMLEECKLAYKAHIIEIGKGANKPAEFLKINPHGTVPVIVDPPGIGRKTATTVKQSGAILFYLAEKAGKFVPKAAAARALTVQWTMAALTDLAPASTSIFLSTAVMPTKVPAVVGFFESRFIEQCKVFDERLGEADYLAGDEATIADFALYPVIFGRQALVDKAPGLQNLKRWAATMAARPATAAALKVA
ncbi:MAG TPA: glutathione S-transferase family protein [Alphaproteobacteria bacterium]|nr:glutathione S-transferase family protein [Alphaproteobacteria bacterium]